MTGIEWWQTMLCVNLSSLMRCKMPCRLKNDQQTGRRRSFGFHEYYDSDAAQFAITHLHGVK